MPSRYCSTCGQIVSHANWTDHRQSHGLNEPRRRGSTRAWRQLRDRILDRDDHRCQVCGSTDRLEVHHIDGDPRNDHETNLTTVCFTHNPRGRPDR